MQNITCVICSNSKSVHAKEKHTDDLSCRNLFTYRIINVLHVKNQQCCENVEDDLILLFYLNKKKDIFYWIPTYTNGASRNCLHFRNTRVRSQFSVGFVLFILSNCMSSYPPVVLSATIAYS